MSELLGVKVERVGKTKQIIMTVKDIHSDANNVRMINDQYNGKYWNKMGYSDFLVHLLLEGADYYNLGIPEFIKEYERAYHLQENENLDDFDEDDTYEFTAELLSAYLDDEALEVFIESSEVLEIRPTDFWEHYTGGDYDDSELPYVKFKVTFKSELWAEKFDNSSFETPYDITQ